MRKKALRHYPIFGVENRIVPKALFCWLGYLSSTRQGGLIGSKNNSAYTFWSLLLLLLMLLGAVALAVAVAFAVAV